MGLRETKPPLVLRKSQTTVRDQLSLTTWCEKLCCEVRDQILKLVYLQGRSAAMSEEGEGPRVAEDLLWQRRSVHTLEHRRVFLWEEECTKEVETLAEPGNLLCKNPYGHLFVRLQPRTKFPDETVGLFMMRTKAKEASNGGQQSNVDRTCSSSCCLSFLALFCL